MPFSDSTYRKLVIAQSVLWVIVLVGGVLALINNRKSLSKNIESKINRAVQNELSRSRLLRAANEETPALPTYDLKIKAGNWRDIQLLVEKMKPRGMMTNEDKKWFPARFYARGIEYKVKVRLRGDIDVHWKNTKKSWRIKFRKDQFFDGYRELDFVIPDDKAYEVEKLAYDTARELGLIAPDSGFANLRINGIDLGLYFWFEHVSKEMIEKLGRPEGEIFQMDNIWTQTRPIPFGCGSDRYRLSPGTFKTVIHKDPSRGFYAQKWNKFLKLIGSGNEEFRRRAPHVLDMEKYLKWESLTWLFGSHHAHWSDNLRWYYDNTQGLFEPLIYDVNRQPLETNDGFFEGKLGDPLALRVLTDPEYMQRRNEHLYRLVTDPRFDMGRRSEAAFKPLVSPLRKYMGSDFKKAEKFHRKTVEILDENRRYLRSYLEWARVFVTPTAEIDDDTPVLSLILQPDAYSKLDVKRLLLTFSAPLAPSTGKARVALRSPEGRTLSFPQAKVLVRGKSLQLDLRNATIWTLRKNSSGRPAPVGGEWRLRVVLPGLELSKWRDPGFLREVKLVMINTLTGGTVRDSLTNQAPLAYAFESGSDTDPFKPIDKFLAECGLPFEKRGKTLCLPAGSHALTRDAAVPLGWSLKLEPGVTLKMGPGVSLVCYGALEASGTADKPISIEQLRPGSPWGALAAVRAGRQLSTLSHVTVKGGGEDRLNGLYLSGQLCFYSSNLKMSNCTVSGATADDGLNVKNATMSVSRCAFAENAADAFDGDWVSGLVTNCSFRRNGGDGLDLSGSRIVVADCLFSGMGDKGLSIGEKSDCTVFNSVIRECDIGAASKDLSMARLLACVLYKNRTALALYRKKQVFGGGKASATSCLIWANAANFKLDGESSLSLTGVGLEKWSPQERIKAEDMRTGDPATYYGFTPADLPQHRKTAGNSPFARGPETKARKLRSVAIPDFSKHPVGLVRSFEAKP